MLSLYLPSFVRSLAMVLLVGALSGCASVDRLADSLNKRGDMACVWTTGSYGPFVAVSALIATGGATLDQCRQMR